ncbi:hypothetical protein [Spiroplasma kunkelii]|nr:hypothetical protein [Spiroplasma kunkelii]
MTITESIKFDKLQEENETVKKGLKELKKQFEQLTIIGKDK